MAFNKIGGDLLESNLLRNSDLSFQNNLLYIDVDNNRIGVKTNSPSAFALDINGSTRIRENLTINGDLIVQGESTAIDSQTLEIEDTMLVLNKGSSVATDAGIMINRGDFDNNAIMLWDEATDTFKFGTTTQDGSTITDYTSVTLTKIQAADPTGDDDLVTKRYYDANLSGGVGDGTTIQLGTPADSTLADGAYLGFTTTRSLSDAIDDLNETMENIRESTFVQSVSASVSPTSGSLNTTVTLTITPVGGGANQYEINWGDGTSVETTSSTTPTHTYATNAGSPFTINVEARNSSAVSGSAGSFATTTAGPVTIFTAQPVANFFIYGGSSGGSPITKADNGSTVYLENTTTNTSGASVSYIVDWGDGSENEVANDSAAGGANAGSSPTRLAHTYNNSATDDGSTIGTGTGDTRYSIKLRLMKHTTADPSVIPSTQTKNFDVYSAHTVLYSTASSTIRGINEEGTSGFPVTFTNDTATNPGAQSTFASNVYTWNFGEGDSDINVNVGSGASGDTGQNITNTFNLPSSNQTNGVTKTFQTTLSLATLHSSTPFTADLNIIVEPDVRANIAGTAVTVSTASGDNSLSLYDLTDLDGTDRAIARFTNTSQNADNYVYDFFDDSSSLQNVAENGSAAGSIGATLDKDYSGTSAGNINFRFRASGTPDTFFQDDEETITFVMKATPSAPAGLSSKTLTLSTTAQGTNPHLCASFDDATGSADTLAAGTSLESTTARRYTSTTPIETNTVTNFLTNNSNGTGSTVNQTVTASINASASGARTFTTSEGGANNATFTDLVISNHRDYDEVDAAYPQRLYLVATAKISQALTDYSAGLNAQRIESSAGGNTGYVHVCRDLLTGTPTTTIGTIAQSAAGNLRYISGVPYYNDGSPSVSITGTTVANFTGQAYQDASDPHEVDPGTNQESTSGDVISQTAYTYANIDGSSTMLSGGIPVKNTGVGSPYTLGTLTQPLTSSSIRAIQQIKARSKNANGTGSYSESSTKIQVYTNSLLTLDNEAGGITVSDSLGAGFDDDAVRIAGFGSLSGDTPSLFDSSNANYYTDSAWSGAVTVAGTNEAISRFGTIKHFTTDLSSGYLPAGPDLNTGRSGAQYYTFAFRRTTMSNFNLTMSGKVSGMFIAAPGTAIDSASSLNGWLDCSTTYGGSGVPGANTGSGGNGSNGCAFNSGDRVVDNTTYSGQEFTFTLGTENATNATGNVILVRIKLESGDSVTALSID